MTYQELFETIGIDSKASKVYLALLALGPSPVRKVATESKINRGTTHQLLRSLIEQGLVSFYHKQKRQYFIAEAPEKLLSLAQQRIEIMSTARLELQKALPDLHELSSPRDGGMIVRSYEGRQGVRTVLEDMLEVMGRSDEKLYRVYSSSVIRETLYKSFPHFTDERIARAIGVRVIAIGAGGDHQELAERRWLQTEERSPTYRVIYEDRVAVISQLPNHEELRSVVIHDPAFYQTEVLLFDQLWQNLRGNLRLA